ncbi:DinB family protein [Pontimicrobium aquaticum]|uniref:DinB family protein n=1 Tax=Pontimicrobium aquaticum TaxID=2565367 RepID=A0A4U0EWQ7_9FLAO|nr:DinB family protein [Pontimicrobium aquaticum]TJY36218.1 DinB family protein [Pontimicrobium aquaticum]
MTHLNTRANALADRLILGATKLANFAENLSDSEWNKPVLGDGRTIGVVIHHVASVYPIEVELAQTLGKGNPITEVSKEAIDNMNAQHAVENNMADRQETMDLLRINSNNAANAIREFTNEELDNSAPVSLYYDAPLTTQFFIEDHALRHSFHHLGKIKASI